jgi:exopolyphosphatase/guanosine-5'-triphosphate,3'-diphosphate pyrophosphatase
VRRAVVDVGSNSVLLTVEERRADGWASIRDTSRVTGLGERARQSGVLHPEAMRRTLQAIREAFRTARELGAAEIVAAGTMALRIAANRDEFLDMAAAQGTPVRVLSGEEEAKLGFLCVASDPSFGRCLGLSVVDIGGHSTEMSVAERPAEAHEWTVLLQESVTIGTLTLIGGPLRGESPAVSELLKASADVDDAIGVRLLPGKCGEVVVIGAAGTNLASIRDRLTAWDPSRVHGATLMYEEVSRFASSLSELSLAERAALPGIESGREGTIHAGALILERCLFALGAESCQVSVRGWRHALLERDAL